MQHVPIGSTGVSVPQLIIGTSALGNLYEVPSPETKRALVGEWFGKINPPVCIDSAGKYGAGLALEEIGTILAERGTNPDHVVISNKLGWKRVPLTSGEPQFEPGVWKNLTHDAAQHISYDGILECYEQGNTLLGQRYPAQLVSVHDPDEYLTAADTASTRTQRLEDIRGAYRALGELKSDGRVHAIGIGAKDWHVIRELIDDIELDWVMFANSFTVYRHDAELLQFMEELSKRGLTLINSAVFNAGFLVGGSYFDYRRVSPEKDAALFAWRDGFLSTCRQFNVIPADACVEFGLAPRAVAAIAMNTSRPERVADNVRSVESRAPSEFWNALLEKELIGKTPEQLR
ncbi:MAG: aldo/keto reductase [Spirochaetota bacterium]